MSEIVFNRAVGYLDMVQRSFMKSETAAGADQRTLRLVANLTTAIGNFTEFNPLSCKTSYN